MFDMSFKIDPIKREIYIDDLGVTFRRVFGVAAEGYKQHDIRQWHVVYKKARIATVKVKDTHLKPLKGNQNGGHANSNERSAFESAFASGNQNDVRASVAVPEGPSEDHGKAPEHGTP
jgi:hypothetical protein